MTQPIVLFTEHFDIRHVVDKLHLGSKTLELVLNGTSEQPVIVEGSTIFRRVNGVYKPEKKEDLQAITASHIVMAYGPPEVIGYHPKPSIYDNSIGVKYRLTGLNGGLIGDVSLPKGYKGDEVEMLGSISRKFTGKKYIFLMNPRQGNGKDSFHSLFGRSLENPVKLPWVLLNRTEYSVYAKSIVKQSPASKS